jgi:hypothetical protein
MERDYYLMGEADYLDGYPAAEPEDLGLNAWNAWDMLLWNAYMDGFKGMPF